MPLAVWRCSDCGATGVGNSATLFAEAETDHMLTGCFGQLRFEREWSPEVSDMRPAHPGDSLPPLRARMVTG